MRSPFTAIVFAFELTHDVELAAAAADRGDARAPVTVLLLRRSILTEKIARRGFHVTREYCVDPLEALCVRDVMSTPPPTLSVAEVEDTVVARPDETLRQIADRMAEHRLGTLPVVDADDPRRLVGVVSQFDLFRAHVRVLDEERLRERVLRLRRVRPHQKEFDPR